MYFFLSGFLFALLGLHGGRERRLIVHCIGGENFGTGPDITPEIDKEILMLPPSIGVNGEISRQINLGESISLEELGPIIINADGTTRRITNWSTLTEAEQKSSWRVISARNLKRLKVLQKKNAEETSSPEDGDSGMAEIDQHSTGGD
jgi:hypothetical protein